MLHTRQQPINSGTCNLPLFVSLYRRLAAVAMTHGQLEHRQRLLDGLSGRVLEVGAGHGLNFPLYPRTVTEVIAVEPENHLRAAAMLAAHSAPVPVRVVPGLAEQLPVEEASADAAVASLVLCSVRDQPRALTELHRVIRPGGELRFYEHVAAQQQPLGLFQRLFDPLWAWLGGGCHLTRDTEAAIRQAGFTIEHIERFSFQPGRFGRLGSPHILGTARR